MTKLFFVRLFLLTTLLVTFLPANVANCQSDFIVTTPLGSYKGRKVNDVLLYPNIAYAKPPIGKLRWQQSLPETEARQSKERFACPQTVRDSLPVENLPMQEDCLYMNVWAPKEGAKHPVVFLIHGGALLSGTGLKEFYDGSVFAKKNVVMVAFNYRLGQLGYGPKLAKEPGSLGLLDQNLALSWVKKNIEHFGGDPENIYLMGHSKGAEAVVALMESGLAGTQVQGGIAMSGIRHFAPDANRSIPRNQIEFISGEPQEAWLTILQRKGFFLYIPELPIALDSRKDQHKYRMLSSVMYAESFAGAPSQAYCAHAWTLNQLPPYIESHSYVWHPGTYDHGDEMVNLFRQTDFGKIILAKLLAFIHKNSDTPAFLPSKEELHVFPNFTISEKFSDEWNKTECGDQKNYPGSMINGKFYLIEKALKWVGPRYFRATHFPPRVPILPPGDILPPQRLPQLNKQGIESK